MAKITAVYMVIFLLFSYFSSINEGGGGIVATRLSSSLDETTTTIQVESTTGFLVPIAGWSLPTVIIRNEEISYTGLTATSFTGCERGYRLTDTDSYSIGTAVYTPEVGVLNKAFGFDIVSTGEDYGEMSVVNMGWNFFTVALGYLVTFNFSLLTGDMIYFRYLMMSVAVGFVMYWAVVAMSTLFGILRG